MARGHRVSKGGIAYHVMNRTWGEMELFEDTGKVILALTPFLGQDNCGPAERLRTQVSKHRLMGVGHNVE